MFYLGGNLVLVGKRSSEAFSLSTSCRLLLELLLGTTSLLTGSAVVDLSTEVYLFLLLLEAARLGADVVRDAS